MSWRAIFYINVPIAAIALIAAFAAVREWRDEKAERTVDYLGVAFLTVALTSFVLALIEGNEWGWGVRSNRRAARRRRRRHRGLPPYRGQSQGPDRQLRLLPLAKLHRRQHRRADHQLRDDGQLLLLAIYLQDLLGYSPLETGVRFLPTTVLVVVAAPVAGRVADRIGSRLPMVLGLVITAVSLYLFSRMTATTTYSDLLPAWILLGIGIGITMSPCPRPR